MAGAYSSRLFINLIRGKYAVYAIRRRCGDKMSSLWSMLSSMAHERIATSRTERRQKSCYRLWAAERCNHAAFVPRNLGSAHSFPHFVRGGLSLSCVVCRGSYVG